MALKTVLTPTSTACLGKQEIAWLFISDDELSAAELEFLNSERGYLADQNLDPRVKLVALENVEEVDSENSNVPPGQNSLRLGLVAMERIERGTKMRRCMRLRPQTSVTKICTILFLRAFPWSCTFIFWELGELVFVTLV